MKKAFFASLFLLSANVLPAYEVLVSPTGPVKSLEAARDAIRQWRAGEGKGKTEPVRVAVANGTYLISQPITLEAQDGGSEKAPVIYEAALGAKPVISGGKQISGWQQGEDGLWFTEIPEVKDGKWYFQELWINGKRATRAKTPNENYLHAERPAEENYAGAPPMEKPEFTAFYAEESDLAPLAKLTEQERKDAEIIVFQTWQIARHRLEYLNEKDGYMQFTAPSRWPFVLYETRQRYLIENIKSALDAPGEWFLDRSGKLFYKPLPDEDITKAEVIAPVADTLLVLKGDPANGKFIENVQFKNLTFRHSGFKLTDKGHIDAQADSKIPAAVMLDGTKKVTFEKCEIAHTGNYGIWFRKGCTDGALLQSHLHDLSAGGVRIGEAGVEANPQTRTHSITVDNNIIQNGGRYFMGSVGIFIQNSGENVVTHNDIGDFFYSGISAGWVWGYAESLAHHNRFEFNHIHHLGYGVLSDMGGFYGLGPASGTIVSNNHVHDISGYRYGGWGLYTDEGSSGVLMENNLVYNTRHSTFHQHYGKDNIIRNNIFAFGEEAQIQRSRTEEHLSFTYANNIVYFNTGVLFYGQWKDPKVRMEQNLYWDAAKRPLDFGGMTFEEWQKKGYEAGSKIADPLFVDIEKKDFRLKPESPAFKMGFKPFDYTKAGVYGDEAWKKLAAARTYPQIKIEPVPVFVLKDGFEKTPVGKSVYNGRVSTDEKGGTILVSDEKAKDGKRSLKFQDAPDLTQRYMPHLGFGVNHLEGRSVVSFDILLAPDTEFMHEWRDKGTPYNAGPSLEIRKGVLRAAGKELLKLEAGQWVHFELQANLGEAQNGKWSLTVTLPDGSKKEFPELALKSAEWRELNGMVFVSDANVATAFYLDNLEIRNEGTKR